MPPDSLKPEETEIDYWRKPATQFDLFKFLTPFVLAAIFGLSALYMRVSQLEWQQAQTVVTPKDFQTLKDQVQKHEFLNQESIDDRKNIHAAVDSTLKILADIQRSQVHIEDALGVKR